MPLGTLKTNITTKDIWDWHNLLMDDFGGILLLGRVGASMSEN